MIVTKINHIEPTDSLLEQDIYKIKRRSKIGTIVAFFLSGVVLATSLSHIPKKASEPTVHDLVSPFQIETNIDDINNMNLILNDDNCGDTFFRDVVDQLKEDGIHLTVVENSTDINENNATVVTLDQQYSAGAGTIIFAPYDNARVGHSDSLALSMQAAFQQNGYIVDNISCGQVGYFQDDDGVIHSSVPTNTENEIHEGYDTSFVTISFGTLNQNPEWVAKSIENGLARQVYYLKEGDDQTDLIYRASSTDSLEDVSNYFGTDPTHLKQQNQMEGDTFLENQTIVNPSVSDMKAFNSTGDFLIEGEKTKAY